MAFTEVPAECESSRTGQCLNRHQPDTGWACTLPSAHWCGLLAGLSRWLIEPQPQGPVYHMATLTCTAWGAGPAIVLGLGCYAGESPEAVSRQKKMSLRTSLWAASLPCAQPQTCAAVFSFMSASSSWRSFYLTVLFSTISPLYFKTFVLE